jgi:hypothetical protein
VDLNHATSPLWDLMPKACGKSAPKRERPARRYPGVTHACQGHRSRFCTKKCSVSSHCDCVSIHARALRCAGLMVQNWRQNGVCRPPSKLGRLYPGQVRHLSRLAGQLLAACERRYRW